MVNDMVLRSQSQAAYHPDNIGHFGLSLPRYAHFTSPIRRYADLLVHRALISGLNLGLGALSDAEMTGFEDTAEHISATERRAALAEREAIDRYLSAYMADKVGASFEARISGVTRFGLFVTVHGSGASGLIPFASLPDADRAAHQNDLSPGAGSARTPGGGESGDRRPDLRPGVWRPPVFPRA
jgi:ribonuclease R